MAHVIAPPAARGEDMPEADAHAAKVLGLQGLGVDDPAAGAVAPTSCSSCVGSCCD